MVRRTKEEAQETRRQILEAAEQAFFERGVSRTTLADIAALAGVTRGAIYWHFSNKADLVQAMLDSLHEPLEKWPEPVKVQTKWIRWAGRESFWFICFSKLQWTRKLAASMKFCFINSNSPMKCVTCGVSVNSSGSMPMNVLLWP